MKLLFIHHAGVHPYQQCIFKAFAQHADVDLTVVVPHKFVTDHVATSGGLLVLERPIEKDGYRVIPVPLRNDQNRGGGFELQPLARVLRETPPEVIHVLDEPVSGFLPQVVWLTRRYFLSSKILSYGMENRPFHFGRRSRLKWRIVWSRMAGATASNSEALENLREAGFPENRPMKRIFRGTCLEMFRLMDVSDLRESLGLGECFVAGFAGRLVPEKGLRVLLAALKRLSPSVHCVIIGSGAMQAELELWSSLPDLKGRVHLIGAVPFEKMPEYLNCFDVLVIPSLTVAHWKEQFGKVIAEAMACGVPVIGSDSGAIPEVVGDAGLICPEGDVAALAEAIQLLYEDPMRAKEFSEKGKQRVCAELSSHSFAEKHIALYQQILR